ncbi:MAG: protein kinase domain-containing protein [Ardenticatenaceae bacterium]
MQKNLVGKQLGQYDIIAEIGRGGMAVIYRAVQKGLEREVALKVLSSALTHDPKFVERFRREALAAARLDHPKIVTIYDVGEQNGVHYIAMKLLSGASLEEIIERGGALPLARAIPMIEQVASALDYAHADGIVHRDIKPGNVMVDAYDRITLTDFGIAKRTMDTSGLTQTGMVMGTLDYIAPEQIQGVGADYRSDIYALGIMSYRMLSGRLPFEGDTASLMYSQLYTPPPPLRNFVPSLPFHVEAAINRALAKNPEDRFQRAGDFAAALGNPSTPSRGIAAQQPAPPPSEAPTRINPAPYYDQTTPKASGSYAPPPASGSYAPPAAQRAPTPAHTPPPALRQAQEPASTTSAQSRSKTPLITAILLVLMLTCLSGLGLGYLAVNNPNLVGGLFGNPTAAVPATETAPGTETAPPTNTPPASQPSDQEEARRRAEEAILTRVNIRPNSEPVFSYFTDTPPVIDGNFDLSEGEWGNERVFDASNVVHQPQNSSGANDISALFVTLWDETYLYLGVEVSDDVLVQTQSGNQIFRGDSLDLTFDADLAGDFGDASLSRDDYQIGVVPGEVFNRSSEVYRWYPRARESSLANVDVRSQRIQEGYQVELRIPWSEIGISPQAESSYGFSLGATDNDTPNTAQLQSLISSSPAHLLRDATKRGTLILMPVP